MASAKNLHAEQLTSSMLHLLLSREYSRSSPDGKHLIHDVIAHNVCKRKPIHLYGYWGAGIKASSDYWEEKAFSFLERVQRSVRGIWDHGMHLTFILADEHAQLNGLKPGQTEYYFDSIAERARLAGHSTVRLSWLWQKYGIDFELLVARALGLEDSWWASFPVRTQLEMQAGRRYHHMHKAWGAKLYAVARMTEATVFQSEFPESLFFTYSHPRFRCLLQTLPALYLWSIRKGTNCPPWLLHDLRPTEVKASRGASEAYNTVSTLMSEETNQ